MEYLEREVSEQNSKQIVDFLKKKIPDKEDIIDSLTFVQLKQWVRKLLEQYFKSFIGDFND